MMILENDRLREGRKVRRIIKVFQERSFDSVGGGEKFVGVVSACVMKLLSFGMFGIRCDRSIVMMIKFII